MKPDTYDVIIDTAKELCGYSGWLLLVVGVFGMILALIYIILVHGLDFQLSIMYLTIIDLGISIVFVGFMFMIRKTKERFDVEQWRDYWMAFAYPVVMPIEHNQQTELKNWLDENIPRLYRIIDTEGHYRTTVVFRHKTDAMACKLKWI
ncbi:hypothetical protein LCGC14_2129300 [marine sediment metagenome]|uniref:Uncharacterized protein n=1 Tax=marine sediment metagenome TaxID=412755 RepID=A0A0F9EP17_9ZZZZ